MNHGSQNPPSSERQIRPLAGLTPDQQRAAWQEAVATATDGKVTSAHVERIAQGEKRRTRPKAKFKNADQLALKAVAMLREIPVDDNERAPALKMVRDWINEQLAEAGR